MVNAMKDIQCEVVGLRHEYGKVKDMLDKEKKDKERLEKEIRSIKQQIDQNRKKWDQERRKLEERLKELEARMEREAERRQQGQLQEGQQEWQESTNWNEDLEYKVEEVVVKKSREVAKQEIARIQNRLEKAERNERRCNIIIRGLRAKSNEYRREVGKFLEEKLGFEKNFGKVFKLGQGRSQDEWTGILVQLESREHKREIMARKRLLKGTRIYIDDDLTREEREVQRQIRQRAKEEEKQGKRTRIGYRKLQIDGKWWRWSDRYGDLCRQDFRDEENLREERD